jgi:hypothetical protein
MRRVTISIVAIMALSSQSYAGGDILPLENEIIEESTSVKVETPKVEEISTPKIKVEEKKPEVVKEPVVVPSSSKWYIGAGLSGAKVSDAHCEDITYGLMGTIGYRVNSNLDIESRAIQTNWEYEGAKVKHLGLFLKPKYALNEGMNLYGLAGYAKTTTSYKRRVDDTGFAYGAGVEYALSEGMNMFVDYEHLLQKSDTPDLDALSLGVSFDF